MPITVLLADDEEVVRRAITRFLVPHPAIKLVGEAANFAQTIQRANDLKPQIIVMDLHLPRGHKDCDRDLQSCLNQGSQLVAISFANDIEAEALAASFGAAKLLDKTKLFDELIPTIMQLASPSASARRTAD